MPNIRKHEESQSAPLPPEKQPSASRPIDVEALEKLFDEWMHEDGDEQRETFEALRKGLDEHRPEGYKLFP